MKTIRTLYQGPIFDVVRKEMPQDGRLLERDVIEHPGGAAILAIHEGKVLLVSQMRAGSGKVMLEIPAGMIDPKEDPRKTAIRELNEETGWQAGQMNLLCSFYPTPGYDSEKLYIYKAENLKEAGTRLPMDADEKIDQIWMDLSLAKKKVADGEIDDAKTMIAILMA